LNLLSSSGQNAATRLITHEILPRRTLVRDENQAGLSQYHATGRGSGEEEPGTGGLGVGNATHITASVYINDDEQGLLQDYDEFLERLAPHHACYRHNDTGEDNGDAHLKRQVMGREVVVAITEGKLDFGPWEKIFYGEFDGRRRKRVLVKVVGE